MPRFSPDRFPDAVIDYPAGIDVLGLTDQAVGTLPAARFIADLDGDAIPDFLNIYGDHPTGGILTTADLFLQDASGGFSARLAVPTAQLSFPGRAMVDDFNRDGRPDIYVATFGNEHAAPSAADVLYLRQPDGSYRRDQRTELPLSWGHGTSSGDINGDGWVDVLSNGNGGGATHILWGGPGGFRVEETDLAGPWSGAPATSAPFARPDIRTSAILDLDGNGRADIFLGRSAWNWTVAEGETIPDFGAVILHDYGTASERRTALPNAPFSDSPGTFAEDWETVDIEAADFDRDGDLDLVLAHQNRGGIHRDGVFVPEYEASRLGLPHDAMFSGQIVQLLENRGGVWADVTPDAVFGSALANPSGALYGIEVVDMNQDGAPDILVERDMADGRNPYMLLGDGEMGFRSARLPSVMEGALLQAFGDIDMDGRVDAVAAGPGPDGTGHHSQLLINYGRGPVGETWYGTSNDDAVRLSTQRAAEGGAGDDHLVGTRRADRLSGGFGDDALEGGGGRDRIFGDPGHDLLRGGAGRDRLAGDAGDDRLLGGGGADRLLGGSGDDRLAGQAGADRVLGQGGDDRLSGGAGADRVAGGPGADLVAGGRGRDLLTGGGGADVFDFAPGHGVDRIRDFDPGADLLRIAPALADGRGVEGVEALAVTVRRGVALDFGEGDRLLLLGLTDPEALSGAVEIG